MLTLTLVASGDTFTGLPAAACIKVIDYETVNDRPFMSSPMTLTPIGPITL